MLVPEVVTVSLKVLNDSSFTSPLPFQNCLCLTADQVAHRGLFVA